MTAAAHGATNPLAGVIVASPATAPVTAPVASGFPSIHQLIAIHDSMPNEPPSIVVTNAFAATPFAARALPALKPNQPNQRRPAPSATKGTLCGATFSLVGIFRGRTPKTQASAGNPRLL